MKFSTTGKSFIVDGQSVWYTFNFLQVDDCATAYFIAFDDDFYARALTPLTTYFEYLSSAKAWIYISGFHVPEELLLQMRATLPEIDFSMAIVRDMHGRISETGNDSQQSNG